MQLPGEIAGLADGRRAEIDDDLPAPDILEDSVALENRANMFGAGQSEKQQVALPDNVGGGGRDVGAVGTQSRQRLRRHIERNDALAALLDEVAADRLAHHAKADEAECIVV
jgi:hypothetical protein